MSQGSAAAWAELRGQVDREVRRLVVLHQERLSCGKGCSQCCSDELTVTPIEAERIEARHAELLQAGEPHAPGACAFLDDEGACRVYDERPYVCRTQGLPLRWTETSATELFEYRDICPKNEDGPAIEELAEATCWTLGPVEARLAEWSGAELAGDDDAGQVAHRRIALRSLFRTRR